MIADGNRQALLVFSLLITLVINPTIGLLRRNSGSWADKKTPAPGEKRKYCQNHLNSVALSMGDGADGIMLFVAKSITIL